MKCVHCGTTLRNESNYCLGCGRPVDAMECYLAEMRESGRVLTRKTDKESLERIMDLTEKIFERTKLNPDLKYEVRAFFESYLPKITDVLSGYRDVSGQKELRSRIGEGKDDLTDVLNTTEEAFELMYRELCENDITELQVHIEALKAQIAADGLVRSDFDLESTKEQ